MTKKITITGLARQSEILVDIIDLIHNSADYEKGVFNTLSLNLLSVWTKQSRANTDLKSNLCVTGIGFVGVASTVLYDLSGLVIADLPDEAPSATPIFTEFIKSTKKDISGLIFSTEGDLSDGFNVGVWVPETFSRNLIIHTRVFTKSEE